MRKFFICFNSIIVTIIVEDESLIWGLVGGMGIIDFFLTFSLLYMYFFDRCTKNEKHSYISLVSFFIFKSCLEKDNSQTIRIKLFLHKCNKHVYTLCITFYSMLTT